MSDPYPPGQPYQEPSPQQPQPGYGDQAYPGQAYPDQAPPQQGYPAAPGQYTQGQYPQAPYPAYPAYAPEPPGKTMGIVGFVLAFVIAPAGIVVSAMALSESKKAGYDNVLGKWGLWLSIVFTSLAVLYVVFILLFMAGTFFTVFSTTSSFDSMGMSV
ncbi:hypothetical protein [Isoptericola sp. NPDC057391]|uniref:hypothetical protein n=1 Tax=Isoptericola sp. NPDC057391 TaxID=3346117 RepID=UPI0036440666